MLEFAGEVILVSLSGVLSPGPLFFANLIYGSKEGYRSGIKIAFGHTIVELPLIMLLVMGLTQIPYADFTSIGNLNIIGIVGGVLVVIFATSNNLVIGSLSSPEVENQEPEQISAQITQAREDIENELKKQGEIMTNAIKQQFGFENVQSNLSQAYQDSFAGGLESAKNQVQSADSALEDSVISLLRSGQQLISASQNESIVLDNNSRVILNNFGETLSNLSITTNELQSQLS